ncbi:MAG TPA: long-chain fatty acid--CoA ligase [Blastocatellia bacterium]|nr:long-chain fatty acid--CoA ligase [Blastocatellia bacterium]
MSEVASGIIAQKGAQATGANVEVNTLVELFRRVVGRDKVDLLNYKEEGVWRQVSSRDLESQVRAAAMGLYALDVRAGDRVGILSENRIEWTIADLGALNCGAADTPIYATQAPKQVAYILNDAAIEVLFISNQAQYDRLQGVLEECQELRVIISFDPVIAPPGKVMSFGDFLEWGRKADDEEPDLYETLQETVTPDSLATVIYTSGTTGDPKGVMLTHANLASNAIANFRNSELKEGEVALTFLPFSHILERTTIYMYLHAGVSLFYAGSVETVAQDMVTARPYFMTSVPRLFEKIYARAMEKAEEGGAGKAAVARWAANVAGQWARAASEGGGAGVVLKLKHKVADALVFSKLREALGGRVRALVSGGAPLAPELARFFYGAGMPVYEGYGLTESSPVISCNTPRAYRIGSVGRPIPGVSVRIADDGEILASGPNVMRGYFNRPDDTKAVLETDVKGRVWLRTGDIGHLDADGYLFITDRKKDLIKTSGGKYVAPQPIENAIKRSRYVNQVVVIGDGRKFPAALIVPQMEALRAYAQQQGIAGSDAELIKHPKIITLVETEVDNHTNELSKFEKIKAVLLLPRELTVESGEMTPTLKVKRRVVVGNYKQQIDQLYASKESK